MTQATATTTRTAYLLKRFPRLSETFILHEILELERQGLDLRLFSLLPPDDALVHADVGRVRAPVTYLPAGWRATGTLLRAHLAAGAAHCVASEFDLAANAATLKALLVEAVA